MQKEVRQNTRSLLYQSINDAIEKSESDYPWIFWTLYYVLFILLALLCAAVFVQYLNPNHTDINSARYLLSSLIQGEATIIAIVVTLTLVAVQLTASAYTPRVSNIFASSPHMYLILGIYIISIAYSGILLQMLNGMEGNVLPGWEILISLAYWLTIILAIALIPYIYYTLELLRPETFIKKNAKHLTKKTILQLENNDFLNSIFDVVHSSIMKYDSATTREGLTSVSSQINNQISGKNSASENSEIIKTYCAHLERSARQAIDLHDEEILSIILDQFEKIGTYCAKNEFDNPTWQVATVIVEVEKLLAAEEIPSSLNRLTGLIRSIGIISIENNFNETPWRITFCMENIAKHAINKIDAFDKFSVYTTILENSIDSLAEFTRLGISKRQMSTVNQSLTYLKSIGEYSLNKESISPLYSIAGKVLDLWLVALPVLENTTLFLDVVYLAYLAKQKTIQKYSYENNAFERKIIGIGTLSMEHSTEAEQNGVAGLLANLRIIDDKNFQYEILHNVPDLQEQKEPFSRFLKLQEKIYQEMLLTHHA